MIAKQKRLIKQCDIPFGRCVAVSVLTSVVSNALAFVHAGLAVSNLFLASVLCAICFKRAGLKRFRRSALTAYLLLMVVFNLPSVLMTALLVFSVALCLAGRLNWNELAATL